MVSSEVNQITPEQFVEQTKHKLSFIFYQFDNLPIHIVFGFFLMFLNVNRN